MRIAGNPRVRNAEVRGMLESYVRDAPKRHEMYRDNLGIRSYACHEYGGQCADWLIKEAAESNGHVVHLNGVQETRPDSEGPTSIGMNRPNPSATAH
jgi:hypothetical protein